MTKKWLFVLAVAVLPLLAFFLNSQGGIEQLRWSNEEGSLRPATEVVSEGAASAAQENINGDREVSLAYSGSTFIDIKLKANQGDPTAQRHLSEIYEDCFAYSLNPAAYLGTLDHMVKLKPAAKSKIEALKKETISFCSTVDDGQPIPQEAHLLWLEQAAKKGDLIAQARLTARPTNNLDRNHVVDLLEKTRRSNDPNALFELSAVMSRAQEDWLTGPIADTVGDPTAEYGWAIAACRAGASCGPNSRVMKSLCMNTGECGYSNYENFVLSQLVPSGGRGRIEEIARAVQKDF